MAKIDDLKNDMANLIERWQMLDEGEIDYEELVECEKKRVEQRMGDLVCGDGEEINHELEDMIPDPICWR